MIDIHCHLLPGIDDGPRNWEEAVALCAAMYADGIRTAVATPHLIDGVYENLRTRVESLGAELRIRLVDAGIDLDLRTGAEVDASSRLLLEESDELPLLGGGQAVLIEMPVAVIPSALGDILFALKSRGLLPVLAHPERNQLLQADPAITARWVKAGAALQVDGDSLLGVWGRGPKRCAQELLARGWVHALASDAHGVDSRPPRLRESLEAAGAIIGADAAKLVNEGPAKILEGVLPPTPLYTVDEGASARSGRRRRGLARLLGRFRRR